MTTLRNLNYGDLTLGKYRLICEKNISFRHWKLELETPDIDVIIYNFYRLVYIPIIYDLT